MQINTKGMSTMLQTDGAPALHQGQWKQFYINKAASSRPMVNRTVPGRIETKQPSVNTKSKSDVSQIARKFPNVFGII